MLDKPISPLRQRMIDDMTARRFKEKVQKDYVRHVRTFGAPPTCRISSARAAASRRLSFVRPSIFASICGREYGPICTTVMRQGSPETSNDASLYYADSCVALVML